MWPTLCLELRYFKEANTGELSSCLRLRAAALRVTDSWSSTLPPLCSDGDGGNANTKERSRRELVLRRRCGCNGNDAAAAATAHEKASSSHVNARSHCLLVCLPVAPFACMHSVGDRARERRRQTADSQSVNSQQGADLGVRQSTERRIPAFLSDIH